MIGKQYKAHKFNVIDIFNNYKEKRGHLGDGINIKFLENRVRSLKNGKFTLVVAGEVKAGKSTFINALIGTEILPSDVLQASNAIVEIFKSETACLNIKFADGKEEKLYCDNENVCADAASERLHDICKIHDEYRQIPTTLIDDLIILNDGILSIDDDFLRQLENQSGEHLEDKQALIEQYIAEKTKDKIPVAIEFGYPLKWAFDELRIVDTPGVNATGGVQEVSFKFFEEANAVLFVHPIKPIESESFKKFVNTIISNRSKETLFLILTHAGLYSNDEVERLHAEAGRLFKKEIPENRILVVDSLLKLIHCDLENGESLQDIRKSENKKKLLSSYREQAEDEGKELIDVIYESSRFAQMFDAIDRFSMKAPLLQLQEILEVIKKGYEELEIQYAEKAERLERKKRNPQEFEIEINRINKALEEYKLLTKETREELRADYSGRHSWWQKDIDELKANYPERITNSDSIDSARKNIVDGLDAVQEKLNGFSKELTQRLGDTLEKTGKAFKEEYHISIPKIDLRALEEKAKDNAYKDEDIGHWAKEPIWKFWKWGDRDYWVSTGTKKVFDDEKFLGAYKTECNQDFYEIVNNLPKKTKEVLDSYLDLFSKEMDSVIADRQAALENEKEKKQSNDDIIAEIKDLVRKKKDIQSEKLRCMEVLEDMK